MLSSTGETEHYKRHKTTRLRMPDNFLAEVDVDISNIVKWLNGIGGVRTRFSCEGDDLEGRRPYVNFACRSIRSMRSICDTLICSLGKIVMDGDKIVNPWTLTIRDCGLGRSSKLSIRVQLNFFDKETCRRFNRMMAKKLRLVVKVGTK